MLVLQMPPDCPQEGPQGIPQEGGWLDGGPVGGGGGVVAGGGAPQQQKSNFVTQLPPTQM